MLVRKGWLLLVAVSLVAWCPKVAAETLSSRINSEMRQEGEAFQLRQRELFRLLSHHLAVAVTALDECGHFDRSTKLRLYHQEVASTLDGERAMSRAQHDLAMFELDVQEQFLGLTCHQLEPVYAEAWTGIDDARQQMSDNVDREIEFKRERLGEICRHPGMKGQKICEGVP